MIWLVAILLAALIVYLVYRPSTGRGVDNPETGYCGHVNTDDARVFGPPIWSTLHMMAQNYPDKPSETTKEECGNFIKSLVYMIPCSKCGNHFKSFVKLNEQLAGEEDARCMGASGESRCEDVNTICTSKENLVSFFVRAHNNVNEHVHPGMDRYTVEDATSEWTDKHVCIEHSKWDGELMTRN